MIGRLTNYILWYHTVWVFIFLLVVGVAAGVFFNAILHFHGDDAFLTGLIFFYSRRYWYAFGYIGYQRNIAKDNARHAGC